MTSFALPVVLLACGGEKGATSTLSGVGGGGTGGAAASTTPSSSSSSASTGSGGPGGSEPTGTPFAYVTTGDGKISVFSLDKQAGTLSPVQEVDGGDYPSFLAFAPSKKALYAVDEGSNELASFAIDPLTGKLTVLNRVSSNGGGPAHVAVDGTGKYVFGVNYGGGNITMIAAMADGSLGAAVTTLPTGANAHQLVLDPANQFAFVPNAGANTISQLVFDAEKGSLALNTPASVASEGGGKPRHLAFHPTAPFAYVIRESDDKITAFPYDAKKGTFGQPLQTLSTLPDGADGGSNTGAEIAFGTSGKFLYGSNRGHNSIVIYSVDAASGAMTLVGHQPTGGAKPRHFSIEASGEILLVGNQDSNEVVTFRVDAQKGTLTELATTPLSSGPSFVEVIYL